MMHANRTFLGLAASAMLFLGIPTACAQPAPQDGVAASQSFDDYLAELAVRAKREGVSQRSIDAGLAGLTYNPRVIALDRAQPGGGSGGAPSAIPAFEPYRRSHVDAARINGGRRMYAGAAATIAQVEREYGVPGSIITAIWGHETNYGVVKGDFDLPRALASLAYEGRRRELFSAEFIATLKMMDMGVRRDQLKGSWAGAFGNPQFLPSVYLRMARDGDRDGVADIWNSDVDTLHSIAHYFQMAGWRRGVPWGVKAAVPGALDRSAITNRTVSPRCPRVHDRHSQWKTVAEWRQLGVVPLDSGTLDDQMQASLLEPDGPGRTAYLLTGNYRVILDYNCSNFYALSVGLLADEIRR